MRRDRLHGVYVNLQLYLSLVDQVHHEEVSFIYLLIPMTATMPSSLIVGRRGLQVPLISLPYNVPIVGISRSERTT